MSYLSAAPENFKGALLTPAQMQQADTMANDGVRLMRAAGWAVARVILQRYRPLQTLVLTGPGHNGGDGAVAAFYLLRAGWPVRVMDYREAQVPDVARAALVIDAIFGAGLSRETDSKTELLLRSARHIVAIDVPSGLDGATGQVRGYAPQAALTVTFVRKKPGHLLFPGRALCGTLVLRDIGMADAIIAKIGPMTWENSPSLYCLPARLATGHKYSQGNVTILSGVMPGAARLAGMAARRAGAGMVSLASENAASLPEAGLILHREPLAVLMQDPRRRHWLVGPGLGVAAAGEALAALLRAPGLHVLADADALTACAGAPARLRGVGIISPHEGEFTRLFGVVGPDKLAAARKAAALINAVVVLKGADTVIAAPDGTAVINANAPPWLATGGTGDVLAGLIIALWARGLSAFEAACAGVWLHGQAGTAAGPGLLAEDLPPLLGGLANADSSLESQHVFTKRAF